MRNTITVIGHYGVSFFMDIAHFPAVGESVEAGALLTEPGGKGYNQAVAATRLGATVNFITAVGDDANGAGCLLDLEREGVAGRYVAVIPGSQTSVGVALQCSGANQVIVYPGAIRLMSPESLRAYAAQIAASDLLLVQNEISAEALLAAVDIAHQAGVPVMYNPAPARSMPASFFARVDCLTPNETEAALLSGQDPSAPLDTGAALHALHGLGVRHVVITLGGEGALVSTAGQPPEHIDACKVDVVSTTGAGDCFNAALAVRRVMGDSLPQAARYAAAAAGLSVSRPGVIPSLPTHDEVTRALGGPGGAAPWNPA